MWAYRLEGPLRLVRHEIDRPRESTLGDGEVVLRFLAGGVCGSDIPRCLHGAGRPGPEPYGLSLHEIVAEVVASRSDLEVGTRVVGWASDSLGLQEYVASAAREALPLELDLPDTQAVALQPLACVMHAMTRLPAMQGKRVAVLGLGSIGLLFVHALRDAGATEIVGVDAIDRRDVATSYGADRVECLTGQTWAGRDDARDSFDVVIEAVGHQTGTLDDAVLAAGDGGTVVYFGNPTEDFYPIRLGTMMDKCLTLQTGRTPLPDRRAALRRAVAYLDRHPDLFDGYVTDVLPVAEAQTAYERVSRPSPERIKVVLDGSR
jgi:L-iditol 2-dehydrogenase